MSEILTESIENFALSQKSKPRMKFSQIGIVGCGTTGQRIALMIASRGIEVIFLELSQDKIDEASLLVTESLINAFEHGTEDQQEVKIIFTTTKNKLVILVIDYGKGFDPKAIEEPDMKSKIRSTNKRGWGMKLMKNISDDFIVESNSNGTKITMINGFNPANHSNLSCNSFGKTLKI